MPGFESFCQPFVVAGQAAKAAEPTEGSFHNPAARQQHKAAFGLRVFDDLQLNPVFFCLLSRIFAGVALINECHLNALSASRLNLAREGRHREPVTLRVVYGPQYDWFPDEAFERLQSGRFTVLPDSDRMGFRLSSDTTISRRSDEEMISDATFTGALQVPPSGQPILLMADRPTTGGYPQIAVVISADLSRAGQLVPGDEVRFTFCSLAEARAVLRRTKGSDAA